MERFNIMVTGPWQSGRMTFLQQVGGYPIVEIRPYVNTLVIPIDDELELQLFRTPGRQRMDFMWNYLPITIGIIELIDSSKPEHFREVRSIFETFRAYYPVPLIVAANKQDLPEAWSIDDLTVALRLKDWLPMVPCVATDHESVRQVLLTLLEYVRADLEEPVLE